jgi:DNA-binding beta-propeller fold protein YncE
VGSGQAGNGAGLGIDVKSSVLNEPGGLAVHPSGDNVYIADTNNHCIKQLNMTSMELSKVTTFNCICQACVEMVYSYGCVAKIKQVRFYNDYTAVAKQS